MKLFICLVLIGCVGTLTGAVSSIGIVKSNGDFRVDGSTIRGNSTVFEGNLIQTAAARSTVELGAAQFTLLPNSSAKVYRDRTVLESGSEIMRNATGQIIEAATLKIVPVDKDGVVLVAMNGPNKVNVYATSGMAQVRTSAGLLVANMTPGMGLAFTPQAGASTASQLKGTVESLNGRFFLTDVTTKNKVELRGPDLAKFVNKSVQVTGSLIPGAAASGGASQVIQVIKIEVLSQQTAPAAGLPVGAAAGTVAAGATTAGIGAGPIAGISLAAAAGITLGALAATSHL